MLVVFLFHCVVIGQSECTYEEIRTRVGVFSSHLICCKDCVCMCVCMCMHRWLMEWTDDLDACVNRIK